jgi:hypothetical protein
MGCASSNFEINDMVSIDDKQVANIMNKKPRIQNLRYDNNNILFFIAQCNVNILPTIISHKNFMKKLLTARDKNGDNFLHVCLRTDIAFCILLSILQAAESHTEEYKTAIKMVNKNGITPLYMICDKYDEHDLLLLTPLTFKEGASVITQKAQHKTLYILCCSYEYVELLMYIMSIAPITSQMASLPMNPYTSMGHFAIMTNQTLALALLRDVQSRICMTKAFVHCNKMTSCFDIACKKNLVGIVCEMARLNILTLREVRNNLHYIARTLPSCLPNKIKHDLIDKDILNIEDDEGNNLMAFSVIHDIAPIFNEIFRKNYWHMLVKKCNKGGNNVFLLACQYNYLFAITLFNKYGDDIVFHKNIEGEYFIDILQQYHPEKPYLSDFLDNSNVTFKNIHHKFTNCGHLTRPERIYMLSVTADVIPISEDAELERCCDICLDKESTVIADCGHMNMCVRCSLTNNDCPECTAKIHNRMYTKKDIDALNYEPTEQAADEDKECNEYVFEKVNHTTNNKINNGTIDDMTLAFKLQMEDLMGNVDNEYDDLSDYSDFD